MGYSHLAFAEGSKLGLAREGLGGGEDDRFDI